MDVLNADASASCEYLQAFAMADAQLLKHLKLDPLANYAPLPESCDLREGLAASVDLPDDADYCDIAKKMLDLAEQFLVDVERQPIIGDVNWPPVSLRPSDAER